MLYVGVDLGKQSSQIAVVNEAGEIQSEAKIKNQKEKILKYIKYLDEPAEVVCETGSRSFWLADMMKEKEIPVHVAHAYKVKLIAEARVKTNKVDARVLGQLLRAKFIPEVYVPSPEMRMWKEVVRGRGGLIRMRTQAYNKIHSILDRNGVEYEGKDIRGKGARSWLESVELPEPTRRVLIEYADLVGQLNEHIGDFEKELKERIKQDEEMLRVVGLLSSIPGIGWLSAITFYLELADIGRFASVKKLWGYVGIVPGVHQTGDMVQRGGRLTKQGNSLLRCLIVEDAWVAIRYDHFYRHLYKRHLIKIGKTRAILPVARALLYAVFRVWSEGKRYEEIFQQQQRVG